MSHSGHAPKSFGQTNNRSIPVKSLLFSSSSLFLIVILNYVLPKSIFDIISGVATVSFVFVWIALVWCHYQYRKNSPNSKKIFPMPLYPVSNVITIIFFVLVLVLLTFNTNTLMSLIFSIVWFGILGAIYFFKARK